MSEKYFLKAEEVAEYLGICRTKVYELIRLGKLRSSLVAGRARRVSREALAEYIREMEGGEATGGR
jgi:excisionase family DNA binding protein